MRTRLSLLVVTLLVAVVAVACGRASQQDIDSALNITPSPTLSVAQVATGTANAVAASQTRTAAQLALSSPGAANGSPVSIAATGDVVLGSTAFRVNCARCHNPSGTGSAPALAGANNPATEYTDEQLIQLIRTGNGHAKPPGPLSAVTISDRQLINILAYIRDQST